MRRKRTPMSRRMRISLLLKRQILIKFLKKQQKQATELVDKFQVNYCSTEFDDGFPFFPHLLSVFAVAL